MKQIAIITGASSGIGKRFAETVSTAGNFDEVWVIARGIERLEALKETVPFPIRAIALDLSDKASYATFENLLAEEIAEKNSICLSKLKQIFKERGGVKSFFITLKIERSKELISEGKMNFTEISDSLGFSSLHYFSKTFKKLTGITPSEYEKGKGMFY